MDRTLGGYDGVPGESNSIRGDNHEPRTARQKKETNDPPEGLAGGVLFERNVQ